MPLYPMVTIYQQSVYGAVNMNWLHASDENSHQIELQSTETIWSSFGGHMSNRIGEHDIPSLSSENLVKQKDEATGQFCMSTLRLFQFFNTAGLCDLKK